MSLKKKIWLSVVGCILIVVVWQIDQVIYGLKMAHGQWDVIWNAKPIEEVLLDPEFPDSLKAKLRLAQEVRAFAMNDLQLYESDTYTKVYDQQGRVLLWNLSACEPYALEAYRWSYPILGKMPYKGFFELEEAKKEAEVLKKKGYEPRIRPVSGWSTLGILPDPILSNMLERSEGSLAEVIIHELTHATIFVKNEIEFNENLASFIGERGAELFLKKKYGDSSTAWLDYTQRLADERILVAHVLRGAHQLDSLYESMVDLDTAEKRMLKEQIIQSIADHLDTVKFYNERFHHIYDKSLPSNAYFMSYMRYHDQGDTLNAIYAHYENDLDLMLSGLKERYGK